MAYKKLKYWFDGALAVMLADKILAVDSSFDKLEFAKSLEQNIEALELKDRVELIADQLFVRFDSNYRIGVAVLVQILGPENEKETGMFTEYYWVMPIAKYVEKYGLDDFDLSMAAIEEITKRNTGEYAIRPYLVQQRENTLAQMKIWSVHPNKHVRRLSSEGVRPRLPWASKLAMFVEDPRPIFPILENLKDDPSKYVQKSVANCLNDILKDNPEMGQKVIENWNRPGIGKERKWIIKHALRNRLKANDRWALEMIRG